MSAPEKSTPTTERAERQRPESNQPSAPHPRGGDPGDLRPDEPSDASDVKGGARTAPAPHIDVF